MHGAASTSSSINSFAFRQAAAVPAHSVLKERRDAWLPVCVTRGFLCWLAAICNGVCQTPAHVPAPASLLRGSGRPRSAARDVPILYQSCTDGGAPVLASSAPFLLRVHGRTASRVCQRTCTRPSSSACFTRCVGSPSAAAPAPAAALCGAKGDTRSTCACAPSSHTCTVGWQGFGL